MRKIYHIKILIMIFAGICTPRVDAGRQTSSVPISLASRYNYNSTKNGDSLPDGPTQPIFGSPARIGGKLLYEINLLNQSKIAQTITIEVISDSVTANAYCAKRGELRFADSELLLCTANKKFASAGGTFSIRPDAVANIPKPITFILPPNSGETVLFFLAFQTIYGSVPSGCLSINSSLRAAFRVSVEEDRGAVIGSVTPKSQPLSPSLSEEDTGFQICGSGRKMEATFNGDYPDSPGIPIFLNGGRPF